jgi:hypothetical protein
MFKVVSLSPHELIPQSAMSFQSAPLDHSFYPTYSGSFEVCWISDGLPKCSDNKNISKPQYFFSGNSTFKCGYMRVRRCLPA